jgi:hypothetical protein
MRSTPVAPVERAALAHRSLWSSLGYGGAAFIVYLSLTPAPHHIATFPFGDKVEHVLAFAVPVWWFGQIHPSATARRRMAIVATICAVALEMGQKLIGGYADVEYGDVLASWAGVLAGTLLLHTRLGEALARVDAWLAARRT